MGLNEVLTSEIQIENYDLICSDRNRHDSGVAYFVRNDLPYNMTLFLPAVIENIFIEIVLPHLSLLMWVVFIFYQIKGSFTEIITEHFSKNNINNAEIYI